MTSAKKKFVSALAPGKGICAAALLVALGACETQSIGSQHDTVGAAPVAKLGDLGERVLVPVSSDPMVGRALYSDASVGFSTYDWTVSEYTPGPGVQNVTWNQSHVALGEDHLSLLITVPTERGQRFASGEIQTLSTMGYGSYSAVLRPALGSGLLSSFYARSEGDRTRGVSEFGFSFQGRDTTDVHIRLVVDDKILVQERIDLPFNAAADFHSYTVDWTPAALIWSVDGKEIHRVERTLAHLPEQPGKLFANVWTGTPEQAHWMGRPHFPSGVSLDIACIAHRPMGSRAKLCDAPIGAPRTVAVADTTAQ